MRVFHYLLAAIVLGTSVIAGQAFAAVQSSTTRSDAAGGVTVKVSYLSPNATETPRFRVVLDTHSVNLDAYDLKRFVVLRVDSGKSYQPNSVENKGSGHHRDFVLSFPKLPPQAKRVELLIKDLAGVKERSFVWTLP